MIRFAAGHQTHARCPPYSVKMYPVIIVSELYIVYSFSKNRLLLKKRTILKMHLNLEGLGRARKCENKAVVVVAVVNLALSRDANSILVAQERTLIRAVRLFLF